MLVRRRIDCLRTPRLTGVTAPVVVARKERSTGDVRGIWATAGVGAVGAVVPSVRSASDISSEGTCSWQRRETVQCRPNSVLKCSGFEWAVAAGGVARKLSDDDSVGPVVQIH